MMLYTCAVTYMATLLLFGGVSAELSTKYKATILDRHNELRRLQKSTNINKLEWDDTLAEEANDWMAQCNMIHEMKGRGENLGFITVSDDETNFTDAVRGRMQDWYDEIKLFRGGSCGATRSCHYTQLVWFKTNKVGCAHRLCSDFKAFDKNIDLMGNKAFYFGCWYSPGGNTGGVPPFLTNGTACSACLEGQTCDNGLCAGAGIEKCENSVPNCAGWAAIGDCEKRKDYMEENCRQACKLCTGGPTADCKDVSPDCAKFGGGKNMQKACDANKQWMADNCAKTCGLC